MNGLTFASFDDLSSRSPLDRLGYAQTAAEPSVMASQACPRFPFASLLEALRRWLLFKRSLSCRLNRRACPSLSLGAKVLPPLSRKAIAFLGAWCCAGSSWPRDRLGSFEGDRGSVEGCIATSFRRGISARMYAIVARYEPRTRCGTVPGTVRYGNVEVPIPEF